MKLSGKIILGITFASAAMFGCASEEPTTHHRTVNAADKVPGDRF